MKRFILFMAFISAIIAGFGQKSIESAAWDFTGKWVNEYTGVATDTLGTVTATTWSYAVPVNKPEGLFYIAKIKVSDKTTGANGSGVIKFQGKYFAADTYTDIDTVTWTGVGSTDTTATFTSITNKVYYRYLRVLVTNTAGKSKISYYKLLIKK